MARYLLPLTILLLLGFCVLTVSGGHSGEEWEDDDADEGIIGGHSFSWWLRWCRNGFRGGWRWRRGHMHNDDDNNENAEESEKKEWEEKKMEEEDQKKEDDDYMKEKKYTTKKTKEADQKAVTTEESLPGDADKLRSDEPIPHRNLIIAGSVVGSVLIIVIAAAVACALCKKSSSHAAAIKVVPEDVKDAPPAYYSTDLDMKKVDLSYVVPAHFQVSDYHVQPVAPTAPPTYSSINVREAEDAPPRVTVLNITGPPPKY